MSQVSITKIGEGVSHIAVRVDLLGDGTGELTNEVVLSASDLVPARSNNQPTFRIMQLWYGLAWFDITLGYGTLQPRPVWTLARDSGCHADFRSFGGLRDYDTVPPGDLNGKLWISTNGLVLGSQGHVIIDLKKINDKS